MLLIPGPPAIQALLHGFPCPAWSPFLSWENKSATKGDKLLGHVCSIINEMSWLPYPGNDEHADHAALEHSLIAGQSH